MHKGKIQQIFPEKYELEKKLENDWQNFLKRDTYLIFEEKNKFFKEINQLVKLIRKPYRRDNLWYFYT